MDLRFIYSRLLNIILIVILGFYFCNPLVGQINIKIGYNIAFPSLSTTNNILTNYRPPNSEVVQPFGSLGYVHGIQIGTRYRKGNIAAEIAWESLSRDLTALSFNPTTEVFSDREYSFSFSGFSLGLDNYIGRYGIGGSLIYQKLNIDRVIGNNDLGIINDNQMALRLQFIWQVQESSRVSFLVKPYYQFSLNAYDLSLLAIDVGSANLPDQSESPTMFGISLVFYNGRQ